MALTSVYTNKIRQGFANFSTSVLWEADTTPNHAERLAHAKAMYNTGVDGYVSQLLVFYQAAYPADDDSTTQSDVNDHVTAIMESKIKAEKA